MSETRAFNFTAFNAQGRRMRGHLAATDLDAAFAALKGQGLTPINIQVGKGGTRQRAFTRAPVNDRDLAALLADLAALLRAGADMRSALGILSSKSNEAEIKSLTRGLSAEIAGGSAIDEVFASHLPPRHGFIASLIVAGEAAGDLAAGLERGSEMLESRLRTRDQLITTLSYPMFVLMSALVGVSVILLFVIPPLAPLATGPGASPGLSMRILLHASTGLRGALPYIAIGGAGLVALLALAAAFGVLGPLVDRFLLRGPLGRLVGAIVYGGFAISLGGILAAGAPASEALRLAVRTTRSTAAQKDLAPVLRAVREGQTLSTALAGVRGLPPSIARLATIGEQTGALGPMLLRGGRFEEQTAFRKIDAIGRLLGPLLILFLGGLIGLMMGGLLSGISGLGQTALD